MKVTCSGGPLWYAVSMKLIRRIVFDAAYQVLMFSVPERLCNALRLYSKLVIKPVVVILISLLFVLLPPHEGVLPLYCFVIMTFLVVMTGVVSRIPGYYVSSLRTSVLRRLTLSGAESSLVRMEVNYIIDQYEKCGFGNPRSIRIPLHPGYHPQQLFPQSELHSIGAPG